MTEILQIINLLLWLILAVKFLVFAWKLDKKVLELLDGEKQQLEEMKRQLEEMEV